jgi:hypothetical protein
LPSAAAAAALLGNSTGASAGTVISLPPCLLRNFELTSQPPVSPYELCSLHNNGNFSLIKFVINMTDTKITVVNPNPKPPPINVSMMS